MDVQKYDVMRPDGTFEERWWKPANSPVLDANGNVVAIIHHVADVTAEHRAVQALRKSERHAQVLLAELQHRVRNTLAIVRSIARRTAASTSSAEDMLAHFQGRLDAFSRVQAILTRNPDARVDLASLIEDELVAHAAHEGDQVRVQGPPIALDAKTAERMSLAIHELTTNAVKHGALTSNRGRIEIRWSSDGSQLQLIWTECGLDLDREVPGREGFGMELLRRSLPYDLDGETEVELKRTGLEFRLRMPLRQ
jgi:two-component system CheB/CheR fusion protein